MLLFSSATVTSRRHRNEGFFQLKLHILKHKSKPEDRKNPSVHVSFQSSVLHNLNRLFLNTFVPILGAPFFVEQLVRVLFTDLSEQVFSSSSFRSTVIS